MKTYKDSLEAEARAKAKVRVLLKQSADGGDVLDTSANNPLGIELQKHWGGDYLIRYSGTLLSCELKANTNDADTTRLRIPVEIHSNLNFRDRASYLRRGHTPGWIYTQRAMLLLYYWELVDHLAVIDLFELQRWTLLPDPTERVPRIERHQLDEFHQPKALYPYYQPNVDQPNDTWLRWVPLRTLQRELHPPPMLCRVSQLYLPGMEAKPFDPHK